MNFATNDILSALWADLMVGACTKDAHLVRQASFFWHSSASADHGWGSGVRESGRRGGIEGATDVGLETAFRWPKVLLLPRRQKCYQQVRNFEQKVRSDDQKTRKMNQQVPDKLRKFSNSRPFHNQTFEKCSMKRYSWIKRSSFLTKMLSLKVSVLWS